jgi:hypothetical protein
MINEKFDGAPVSRTISIPGPRGPEIRAVFQLVHQGSI